MTIRAIHNVFRHWQEVGDIILTDDDPVPGLDIQHLTDQHPLKDLPQLNPGDYIITKHVNAKLRCQSSATSMDEDSLCESPAKKKPKLKSSASATDSIVGSPLKMQEFADLSMNDDADVFIKEKSVFELHGLDLKTARYIMNECSCTRLKEKIVVICDGKSKDGIVALIYNPNKEYNIMQTICVNVFDKQKQDWSINELKRLHHINTGHSKPQVQCSASYNIRTINRVDGPSAFIRLDVKFPTAVSLLDNPPSDSQVTVNIRAIPGCKESRLMKLHHELIALQGFCDALGNRQISWLVEHREEPVLESVQNMFKKMTSLKTSVPSPLDQTCNETTTGDNTVMPDLDNGPVTGAERTLQDFTEQLWPLLIECSSYKELCDCLTWLFQTLRTSRIIPVVEPSNPSELARIIRSADEHANFNTPNLVGVQPLNLLIEIGVFKLRRDYLHFFTNHGVNGTELLAYYQNLSVTTEEQVARLQKLHVAMETVTMAMQYLNDLEKCTIGSISLHCLQYYHDNEPREEHVFSVPVHYKPLHTITQSVAPSTWSVVLESVQGALVVRTTCELTDAPPVGYGVELLESVSVENTMGGGDGAPEGPGLGRYSMTKIQDILVPKIWSGKDPE